MPEKTTDERDRRSSCTAIRDANQMPSGSQCNYHAVQGENPRLAPEVYNFNYKKESAPFTITWPALAPHGDQAHAQMIKTRFFPRRFAPLARIMGRPEYRITENSSALALAAIRRDPRALAWPCASLHKFPCQHMLANKPHTQARLSAPSVDRLGHARMYTRVQYTRAAQAQNYDRFFFDIRIPICGTRRRAAAW